MGQYRIKNDPLNDPQNEYNKLRSDFIFEYGLRTASIKTDDDLIVFEQDCEFQKWEKEQQQKINEAFKEVCKRLNRDEIFYFGCPFSIYKKTYPKRLKVFLNSFLDTDEADFINGELEYLEHTFQDLENSENSGDGYSLTGYENFKLASRFGNQIGVDQFTFSTNKKIEFLESKQNADRGLPQQIEISDIENDFDHVDISKVYDYFNKELVKANFLTDGELKQYLKVAFEQKDPPKNRFTFKNDPQKSVIRKVFYKYYKDVAARGRRKEYRKECASLLGEYFNGYNTKNVLNNFNK